MKVGIEFRNEIWRDIFRYYVCLASQKEFTRFIAVTILRRSIVFLLSCTALFDVAISVLFGCRSTPVIRIIAGKQGGWPLGGSVYACCGAFNKAETIKPVFFGALVKLLLKATTSLMSVRLHGTVPLPEGFLWNSVLSIFNKICCHDPFVVKMGKDNALCEDLRIFMIPDRYQCFKFRCCSLWGTSWSRYRLGIEHDQLYIFASTISRR